MKKDILKDFVADNRSSFDEYEPGLDVLSKIQTQLEMVQPVAKKKSKVVSFRYWWAAAAIVAAIVGVVLFSPKEKNPDNTVVVNNGSLDIPKQTVTSSKDTAGVTTHPAAMVAALSKNKKTITKPQPKVRNTNDRSVSVDSSSEMLASNTTVSDDWRQDLQNARSSSTRLAAILAAGKEKELSNSDLQTLSNTMNNDESSNVRLAALDVLKKQGSQASVKDLILQSITKQDDPIVQMELLSMLSPDEATKVKSQLLDITQNPMSIDAVRSQAYAALLRSNSNF
ncbi:MULTISPECIES: HEAT repeat domain-containing protein [Chitinophagaceae]